MSPFVSWKSDDIIGVYEANLEFEDKVIREGAEKARKVAQETLVEVRRKMGLE